MDSRGLRPVLALVAAVLLRAAASETRPSPQGCRPTSPARRGPPCEEPEDPFAMLQYPGRPSREGAGQQAPAPPPPQQQQQQPPPPPDGTYLLKLLFMRHGMSCANVLYSHSTKDAAQLDRFRETGAYNETLGVLDGLMREPAPSSVGGIDRRYGIKPAGAPAGGAGPSEALVRASGEGLPSGGVFGISPLVKDPHITRCAQRSTELGSRRLAEYLDDRGIELSLVGASTLARAIESAELMFKPGRKGSRATRRLSGVAVLPFLNERDPGVPTQPECYPYEEGRQLRQMQEILGSALNVSYELVRGSGSSAYPKTAHEYDKFKVMLALNVLPFLHADRGPISTNPELAAALNNPKLPDETDWSPDRLSPGPEGYARKFVPVVRAGALRYERARPFAPEAYEKLKARGAREFVLGLGSHSVVIKRYCMLNQPPYVNNFAVVEKLMKVKVATVNGATTFRVAEGSGACRVVMDAPDEPKELAASDLGENCMTPFNIQPVADLVDAQPQPASGETQCVADGKNPEAWTLHE